MLLGEVFHQERCRKGLSSIPFFFTFANAFLGFLAIVYIIDGHMQHAIYSVIFAAILDGIDGRIARALGMTSSMGVELDSLADAISFCLAPCVILYNWYFDMMGLGGLMILACYLCSGIFRLARFNVTAPAQQNFFVGLPVPVAAIFLMSLLLRNSLIEGSGGWLISHQKFLFVVVGGVALLMVSKIPFPTGKRFSLASQPKYIFLGAICLLVLWFCSILHQALFIGMNSYIIGSCVVWVFRSVRARY